VLIVGGGPVALAMAGDVGWHGIPCVLVEKTGGGITQPRMAWSGCAPWRSAAAGASSRGSRRPATTAIIRTETMRREWFVLGIQLGYRYEDSPVCIPDDTPEPPDEPAIYEPTAVPATARPTLGSRPANRPLICSGADWCCCGSASCQPTHPPSQRPLPPAACRFTCRIFATKQSHRGGL
jgi:hypothetical protein